MESIHEKLKRVRKPRVHITYEVETEGAEILRELPFVVGIMSDFFAGRRALRVLGGCAKGRLTNLNQVSHDLHVGQVYLHFLERNPPLAAGWVTPEIEYPSYVALWRALASRSAG